VDFSSFLGWLQGLGPMGNLASVFFGALLPLLYARVRGGASGPAPSPTPAAAGDADATALVKQQAAVAKAIAAKKAALQAELDKLGVSPAAAA
jgi:hypothetical protein